MSGSLLTKKLIALIALKLILCSSMTKAEIQDIDPRFASSPEDCFVRHINCKYDLINKRIDLFENGSPDQGCDICSLSAVSCCLPCFLLGKSFPFGKKHLTERQLKISIKNGLSSLRFFIKRGQVDFRFKRVDISNEVLLSELHKDFDLYLKSISTKMSHRQKIKIFKSELEWKGLLFMEDRELDSIVAKAK